jgi:hypothetical protein
MLKAPYIPLTPFYSSIESFVYLSSYNRYAGKWSTLQNYLAARVVTNY